MPITNFTKLLTATVPNGGTDSDVLDVRGAHEIVVILPDITGTTLGIKVHSGPHSAGVSLYDENNNAVSYTVAGNRAYRINIGAARFISLVLATQGAERLILVSAS